MKRKDKNGNYKTSGHAYSILGYKQKNYETYIEILNLWLSDGFYLTKI